MLKNTTFNLPEDLVARAKAYAASSGTTMTAIVRSHLEAVVGSGESGGEADPLLSYSRGEIDREAAGRHAHRRRDRAQAA